MYLLTYNRIYLADIQTSVLELTALTKATEKNMAEKFCFYGITETARTNNLKVYGYVEHLLTDILKHEDDINPG